MNNDELLFQEEDNPSEISVKANSGSKHPPWKILVVDDEEQVHTVTELVLRDFSFDERPLQLLHAYSATQAIEIFENHDDIAMCLLDVVMETDTAGLEVVGKVRMELKNAYTRIVLRTGQPGQAPEEEVIREYDINDYKDKTELTRLKLHTLVYSCLRAYRDIISLDHARRGLEQVVKASNNVFKHCLPSDFAQGILQQFSSLMRFDDHGFYAVEDGLAAQNNHGIWRIIEGIGDFSDQKNHQLDDLLPQQMLDKLAIQTEGFMSIHTEDAFLASSMVDPQHRSLLYLKKLGQSSALQCKLLDIFSNNVLIAFQNLYLMDDIEKAQREMVYLLAEAIETRSSETAHHLQRVAELSLFLAVQLDLDEDLSLKIHRASPLHDLGKIAIAGNILNKPGKLTDEEYEVVRTHAQIGRDMIASSERELSKTAMLIALEHHEHWDGSGYPNGKKGTDISIEGRITAVADVFDALSTNRCYKEAWTLDAIFAYMKEKSASQFDPQIIDIVLTHEMEIREIYHKYSE
ncbi:MAG: DUF3369 domain-containing protein [Pseudomonadota bacterium]